MNKRRSLVLLALAAVFLSTSANAGEILSMNTQHLKFVLDDAGRISSLQDIKTKKEYISDRGKSFLLRIQQWNGKINPKKNPLLVPAKASVLKKTRNSALVELKFKSGESITIRIDNKTKYIKMTLVKITPSGTLSKVTWGAVYTAMRELPGRYVGIARSKDFSIGLLSLEMNTDAPGWDMACTAYFDKGGTVLTQESYDRTKPRALEQNCEYVISKPVNNIDITGSSVALFGVPAGEKNELDIIEAVELAENLPHPMFRGVWTKRSKEMQSPCLWMSVKAKDIDKCLALGKDFAAGSVCQFHGFFGNWGHFDVYKKDFPTGITGVQSVSEKLLKAGMHNTTYTLTSFLKPHPETEPYIAPTPDDRLANLTTDTNISLAEKLSSDSKTMKIRLSKGLTEQMKNILQRFRKVLRIDNEMIEFKAWEDAGNGILICKNLDRGGWLTTPANHDKGAKALYMYVSGYNNFYPGTLDMSDEVAKNIGDISVKCKVGKITLDGYESVLIAGQGSYGRNIFIKKLYDMTRKNDMLFSASNMTNYSWHIMSFISWGEFDKAKGFRGTMLEIRLKHQVGLAGSLMPKKLGQYYPDKNISIEDMEWLCNQIAGWDSRVDLCM